MKSLTWDYSANLPPNIQTANFRVWVPDLSRKIRGFICLVPGTNADGRGMAGEVDWQNLATELQFGIIACFFQDVNNASANYCIADNGSGAALLEALDAFADYSGHPEAKTALMVLWGHSAGGQFNFNFACWKPSRVLTFVVNKGAYYYRRTVPRATQKIPALFFLGQRDTQMRIDNITRVFEKYKERGANWQLCKEIAASHDVGKSQQLSIEFFKTVVAAASLPKRLGKVKIDTPCPNGEI